MYNLAMTTIPATQARQRWAQTLDQAKKAPVTITEHGRETVVILDADLSRRALEALQDAEDAAAAAEAEERIAAGEETIALEDIARELGIAL